MFNKAIEADALSDGAAELFDDLLFHTVLLSDIQWQHTLHEGRQLAEHLWLENTVGFCIKQADHIKNEVLQTHV